MALNKAQRDALPDEDFAVPGKRALPFPDSEHARMAWNMVDRAKGLTDDERKTARERILKRAAELGVDTKTWNIQALHFEAMALDIPDVQDHPNRIPFEGILTRVDEPSDNPPGGSSGKRVMLSSAVAEAAIPSILGMAVDFADDLDGHNAQQKIGLITEAWIDGSALKIKGFFYGADFADEVQTIQAQKEKLGFSYECQARIASMNDDPLIIEKCTFTGAAVLYKDLAAYTTTQLAAQADFQEISEMDIKELMEAVAKLTAQNEALMGKVTEMEANSAKLSAASVLGMVKPHADALRAAADGMEKSGYGMHEKRGHVAVLRGMADRMESDAVMGKTPHIIGDEAWFAAATDVKVEAKADPKIAELEGAIADLKAAAADTKAKEFNAAAAPERKTLTPAVTALLAKAGIAAPEGDAKLDIANVDTMLTAAGVTSRTNRMAAKLKLRADGLL